MAFPSHDIAWSQVAADADKYTDTMGNYLLKGNNVQLCFTETNMSASFREGSERNDSTRVRRGGTKTRISV